MKIRMMMKCMAAVLCLWISAAPVMAQKNIDKLVEEIEKRDDASINSVTKRDPKTRKITRVVKNFTLKDEKMAKRLLEAFEKDEEYAITAIKDMPQGRKVANNANFTFIFEKNGQKQTYMLNTNPGGHINLTINIKEGRSGDTDVSDISFYFDTSETNNANTKRS